MAQQETEHLTRILISPALACAVSTIAELGIADLVQTGQPQQIEHLARASKTHEPSLYRILRFMAGYGLFQESENRHFDHTPLSAALRSDAPGSYRAAAQLFHPIFAAWEGLHHSIQTGEPAFNKVFGAPIFEYIPTHPELGPLFDAGMTSINYYETDALLEAYDFAGINVLADIGGGNGSLISAVLARYPKMHGILFDLGHVVGGPKRTCRPRAWPAAAASSKAASSKVFQPEPTLTFSVTSFTIGPTNSAFRSSGIAGK